MTPLHHYAEALRSLACDIEEFLNHEFVDQFWSDESSDLEELARQSNAFADLISSHDDLPASLDRWINGVHDLLVEIREEQAENVAKSKEGA